MDDQTKAVVYDWLNDPSSFVLHLLPPFQIADKSYNETCEIGFVVLASEGGGMSPIQVFVGENFTYLDLERLQHIHEVIDYRVRGLVGILSWLEIMDFESFSHVNSTLVAMDCPELSEILQDNAFLDEVGTETIRLLVSAREALLQALRLVGRYMEAISAANSFTEHILELEAQLVHAREESVRHQQDLQSQASMVLYRWIQNSTKEDDDSDVDRQYELSLVDGPDALVPLHQLKLMLANYAEVSIRIDELPDKGKIPLIKMLREITEMGLAETKGFTDRPPAQRVFTIKSMDAENVCNRLISIGAKVSIVEPSVE